MKPNAEVQGDDTSSQQRTKSEQATIEESSAAKTGLIAEGLIPERSPRPEAVQKLVGLFEVAAEAKQGTPKHEGVVKTVNEATEKIDEQAEGTVGQAHPSENPEETGHETANTAFSPSKS